LIPLEVAELARIRFQHQCKTYVLDNTSALPTKPVNNFPKTPGSVIEPALWVFKSCT
jgi:hypothetical protein